MRQKYLSAIETCQALLRKAMNMETFFEAPEFYSISARVISRDVSTNTSYLHCQDRRTYNMVPETQEKSMVKALE
jgi:hypothetical protein